MLFGQNHITQVDPKTFTILSDWVAPAGFPVWDLHQGVADGQGHLFVADRSGNVVLLDYSATGRVSDPGTSAAYQMLDPLLEQIALLPATVTIPVHPIIFVHGINMDANVIGLTQNDSSNDQFVPLFESLKNAYSNSPIKKFNYVDDQSLKQSGSCPLAPPLPPCVSQSAVSDNASSLAQQIRDQYAATNHKVALIGYSMGAAIIRSVLACCPDSATPCTDAASLVDDVFFLNGVQQGSYLMTLKNALDTCSNTPVVIAAFNTDMQGLTNECRALNLQAYNGAKQQLGLDFNYPAEKDLTPQSANILAHNQQDQPPGTNINYFNFYGDIQTHFAETFWIWTIYTKGPMHIGDTVLLQGNDSPTADPSLGGARFCLGCGNESSYTTNQAGLSTYSEWPLSSQVFLRINNINNPAVFAGPVETAPQMHTNIYSDTSLNAIQVQDATQHVATTTIPQEIVWELMREDGIPG